MFACTFVSHARPTMCGALARGKGNGTLGEGLPDEIGV